MNSFRTHVVSCAGVLAVLALLAVTEDVTAASRSKRTKKRPITRPKFDPTADRVGLFKGMEEGKFDVRIIARDEKGGNVLIENKSKKPLTVKLPDAFVGVQVLKQFGMGAGGMGGGARCAASRARSAWPAVVLMIACA